MSEISRDPLWGVVARLDELIASRPNGAAGGFAPGGKVRTHQYGTYRSAYRGRGMEFDEARVYQPGDDIRTIDWRVTARTGRTHTKLFHEERERPVLILVDARAAMRFGTRGSFKSVLAAKAGAILTWVSIEGGDRVGGMVMAPSGLAVHQAQRSRARILGFVKAMADATQEGFVERPDASGVRAPAAEASREPSLAESLSRLRRIARPGSLIFVVSDFHDFDALAARELSRLSLHAHVTNLFVYDAVEAAVPVRGVYRLSDGEQVAMIDAGSRSVREAYARRFAARREAVELLARQRGMAFVPLRTGQDPADILHPERLKRAGVAKPAGAGAAEPGSAVA